MGYGIRFLYPAATFTGNQDFARILVASEAGFMFDETLAKDVATRMASVGKRPSVRTVRQALTATGNSGSLRRVAEVLRDWRKNRGLSEFEADTGVPPEFQTRIDAVTATLWEAAKTRADAVWREERARLSSERDEARRDLDEALAKLADVDERLRAAVLDVETQTRRADEAEKDQKRRAKEYWDRVLRAASTLLEREGRPMLPSEILELLSDDLHREANYQAEALDQGTLTEKLKVRGRHSRYVEPMQDGSGMWRHRSDARGQSIQAA